MKHPGVYVPDNPRLHEVLAQAAGQGFRPDHARLLLHFVCLKRWMGDLDGGGFARLNAGILRQWIQPRALGPLKHFLLARGVLVTDHHSAGRRAIGFRLAEAFDGPPVRHTVIYWPLAEKLVTWRTAYKAAWSGPAAKAVIDRRRPLLDHLRDSLAALSLPASPAAMVAHLRGQVDAGHVAYVTQCIVNNDHDGISIDPFGWRVHNLITRTSSHLRPLLLLDGQPVAEVDIANSQPLLLAILLARTTYGGAHNIVEGTVPPSLPVFPVGGCSGQDARDFLAACESGALYELLAETAGIQRLQAKRELFRDVLFGKAHVTGRVTRAFGELWPSLLDVIRVAKIKLGYKAVAQALQRLESFIMLDRICPRLLQELPGLPFLTVHDSALMVADEAEAVQAIMLDEFANWGATPTIRIKPLGHNSLALTANAR